MPDTTDGWNGGRNDGQRSDIKDVLARPHRPKKKPLKSPAELDREAALNYARPVTLLGRPRVVRKQRWRQSTIYMTFRSRGRGGVLEAHKLVQIMTFA